MSDPELIELLATRGMGWELHDASAHRPGTRKLPHAWRWPRAGGVRLMVYDGAGNREWNPLGVDADLDELLAALHGKGITLHGKAMFDKRAACEAAAAALPAPADAKPPKGDPPQ